MNLTERVLKVFYEKSPNSLLPTHIFNEFPGIAPKEICQALEKLKNEKRIFIKSYPNHLNPKLSREGYTLPEVETKNIPAETELRVGDFRFPRLLDGDTARGEDINSIVLYLNKFISEAIVKLKFDYEKEIKSYWSSVITIFGLFFALFSIVNIAIKPISFGGNLSGWQMFLQSSYNIAPLTIVLFLFTGVLFLIFRK